MLTKTFQELSSDIPVVKVKTRFAEGHYYIGRAYFSWKNINLPLLQRAVDYDTEAVDYHYSFGMLYSDADAFCALAEAQFAAGMLAQAKENIDKALALVPESPRFQKVKKTIYG